MQLICWYVVRHDFLFYPSVSDFDLVINICTSSASHKINYYRLRVDPRKEENAETMF